jgi:hypothetical protein
MIRTLKTIVAGCGVWVAVLTASTAAVSAPVPSNTVVLRAAVAGAAIAAQARRNTARRDDRLERYGWGPQPGDTIGSLGHDSRGNSYNRFSGQVYQSCMEDLGYGRVRPCDAGSL